MKVSSMFGGLLVLFVLIHGYEDVSVTCTIKWLQVRIKRRPLVNYLQSQPYELYLRMGCPVTAELLDFFEFLYLITCGIKIDERPWGIVIKSSITYAPVNSDTKGFIPISCFLRRKFPFTLMKKLKVNSSSVSAKTVEKKNATSLQAENLGLYVGVSFGNSIPLVGVHNFFML